MKFVNRIELGQMKTEAYSKALPGLVNAMMVCTYLLKMENG